MAFLLTDGPRHGGTDCDVPCAALRNMCLRPGVGRPFRFRFGPQFGGHTVYPVLGAQEGVAGVGFPVARVFTAPQPPSLEAGRFAVKSVLVNPPGEVLPQLFDEY